MSHNLQNSGLPARVRNSLCWSPEVFGVKPEGSLKKIAEQITAEKVASVPDAKLLRIQNVGAKSFALIKEWLRHASASEAVGDQNQPMTLLWAEGKTRLWLEGDLSPETMSALRRAIGINVCLK